MLSKSASILRVEGLTKRFRGLTALENYALDLQLGEIVGIIGPNGAGKTTIFNLLTGLIEPSAGTITWKDRVISYKSPRFIASQGIMRTFQNIRLFNDLTVLENVMIAAQLHKRYGLAATLLSLPSFVREEKRLESWCMELLDLMGIAQHRDRQAGSLPYGEQRKLEIARALAARPELLLLDEPAAGMNPSESWGLMELIRKLRDTFNLTVLLIEHDMRVAMNLSNRLQVLSYGKIIAEGQPQEIQAHPQVIEAYLGRSAAYA